MASSKRAMAALKQVVASEKQEIGVILLYGLAASVLFLVVPIGVQTLVNNVGFGTLNQPVLFLILAVFAGLACAGLFRLPRFFPPRQSGTSKRPVPPGFP